MTAPEILCGLTAKGVHVDVIGDRLHVRAPKGVLTEDVVAQLREVKPHLLELLGEPPAYQKAKPHEQCERCQGLRPPEARERSPTDKTRPSPCNCKVRPTCTSMPTRSG